MEVINHKATHFSNNEKVLSDEQLLVEEALEININDQPFTVTMRTPGNDKALILGLLFSEKVIKTRFLNPEIVFTKKQSDTLSANVLLDNQWIEKEDFYDRSMVSVSSCGICGKTDIESLGLEGDLITNTAQFSNKQLSDLFGKMEIQQQAFLMSGGAHAAAIFNAEGELLTIMEDIGRHNAVDKVIGQLISENVLDKAKILLVSGRTSFEIVSKAATANIPILAAVSAPSSLAVSCAERMNLTLLGFCRGDRSTCYSHPQRIV